MSILSKDELMKKISELIGENDSDEIITLIEDLQDTINNYENDSNTEWKDKFEKNDKEWRNKYKERFFAGKNPKIGETEDEDEDEDEDKNTKPKSFEDLFK